MLVPRATYMRRRDGLQGPSRLFYEIYAEQACLRCSFALRRLSLIAKWELGRSRAVGCLVYLLRTATIPLALRCYVSERL